MFDVLAIDDSRTFRIGINTNPGGISTITTNVPYTLHDQSIVGSGRTFAPFFNKRDFGTAYQIYTNETIQEYKRNIQDTGIIMGLQQTSDYFYYHGFSELFYGDNSTTIEEDRKQFNKVSKKDIQERANEIFQWKNMFAVLYGQVDENKIKKLFSKSRF